MTRHKLASVIDQIYGEISSSISPKDVNNLSVENPLPNISSSVGQTLLKIAQALKTTGPDVTYNDLNEVLKNSHER